MAKATACANIALVKYWGKRQLVLNLPAAGSLSLTLDRLRTHTEVTLTPDASIDALELDGSATVGRPLTRITEFLELVRTRAAADVASSPAKVTTHNDFPSAAGLASSASGFAALAVAASKAYGVDMSPTELSVLARRGSGSACRSIFGGYARWDVGTADDGTDSAARAVDGIDLELAAAIAVVHAPAKTIGSTEGMERTRETSPFHEAWIAQVDRDLDATEDALRAKDIDRVAELVEGSCLAMHANAMAARPGIIYWKGATLWAIERVRALRASGTPVFFTIDAGPHLVAFTPPEHVESVAAELAEHADIDRVITSVAGEGAHLVD